MEKRKYLMLVSASRETAAAAQAVQRNIAKIDPLAKALWLDARGAGFFIQSSLTSHQIASKGMEGLTSEQAEAMRDLLVLELAQDHWARNESAPAAWLNARRQSTPP